MTWDSVWQIARYLLIAGFSFLTGKGYITAENAESVIGAIGTIGAIVWGIWVKWNTSTVTSATAERVDVPTVSAATGTTKP